MRLRIGVECMFEMRVIAGCNCCMLPTRRGYICQVSVLLVGRAHSSSRQLGITLSVFDYTDARAEVF